MSTLQVHSSGQTEHAGSRDLQREARLLSRAAAVSFAQGVLQEGQRVRLALSGANPVALDVVRVWVGADGTETSSLRAADGDWNAYRALTLWIFHTPDHAVPGFPPGVPAAASLRIA